MSGQITVNRLPVRTWHFLRANGTRIDSFDIKGTRDIDQIDRNVYDC